MKDMVLISELEDFEKLFDLTVRGIDAHMKEDVPDPDFITGGLLSLDRQLEQIIEAAKGRKDEDI